MLRYAQDCCAVTTQVSFYTHAQVDFASTFLDTPGEFISIWSEVTTLTWSEVQSAAPIFFTMGGILVLAVISAGLGWRFDQKVTTENIYSSILFANRYNSLSLGIVMYSLLSA